LFFLYAYGKMIHDLVRQSPLRLTLCYAYALGQGRHD
jgi:hypothetical protein